MHSFKTHLITHRNLPSGTLVLIVCAVLGVGLGGCASLSSIFPSNSKPERQAPILSPFQGYSSGEAPKAPSVVLRTRKGDRSFEVELPASPGDISEFAVPLSPSYKEDLKRDRSPASNGGGLDDSYLSHPPSATDREITSRLTRNALPGEDEGRRREIETGLGLMTAQNAAPASDQSYLAALDHVKGLYRVGRYEAGLLELDGMLRSYPTDPKLYEMKGTLLDRLGREELAIQSWDQAIRLKPDNASLRKFIERKRQKRSLASP